MHSYCYFLSVYTQYMYDYEKNVYFYVEHLDVSLVRFFNLIDWLID